MLADVEAAFMTPSTYISVLDTETLSVADTLILTIFATVAPGAGERIFTTGGMVSTVLLTVTVIVALETLLAMSYAFAVNW